MIVTDLDGTLLPESKLLPRHTREVLGKLAAQGVVVALASGKFFHLTQHYAEQLEGPTPVVALDGARIKLGAKEVTAEGIPREVAHSLLESFGPEGVAVFVENGKDEMLLDLPDEEIPQSIRNWASRIQRVDNVRAHLTGDPAIMVFYDAQAERLQELADSVTGEYRGIRTVMFPQSSYGMPRMVMQPANITKGTGVAALCAHFGFEPDQCMVFGDWYNDLPLFAAGCTNVAMANAVPPLIARAEHVTELDCNHEGVAHFLEKAFL